LESPLTKNTILQVNATIIAGLLIFLTIQSVTTDSLFDLVYRSNLLNAEDVVLTKLQDDVDNYKKIYENVDENGTIIIQPNPDSNSGEVSFTIPPPQQLLEKHELQISQMSEENFRERVKLQAKLEMQNNLHPILVLYSNPNLVASLLIIPFIMSAIFELFSWCMHKTTEILSIISIVFLISGLVFMLGLFFMFAAYHLRV